jgi:succinate-acetate transporter protein
MDGQTIGLIWGIAGGAIGILGGIVGTYFGIKRVANDAQRKFMIRCAAGLLYWPSLR